MKHKDYYFSIEKKSKEICALLNKNCDKILRPFLERIQYKSKFTQIVYTKVLEALVLEIKNGNNPTQKEVFLRIVDPEGKYKLNTRKQRFYALKFIFETFGWDVPVFIEEITRGEKEIKKKKTFSNDEIEKIINTAKEWEKIFCIGSWCCSKEYIVGVIVLSTIYGLRRGEIYAATKRDWSKEDNTFLVKSQKGSVIRYHVIFDEIKEYLEGFFNNIQHPPDRRYLNVALRVIEHRAGIKQKKHRNFHTIRKSVASMLLQNGANPVFVNDFLRWKGGGTMLSFYAHLDPVYVDNEIKKYHSFLKMW